MSTTGSMLLDPRYLSLHIAIVLIAGGLIATLIHEMRKPKRDPNEDPDTKRMNDMLKD
ncbi:hypothetical protein [Nitratifractor sp.]|uniref:hypothetical protein n=1 Tax=Nitratifractor sp. TaxID=2268144 RepID=UPI0025DB39E8|nr:hypothetical protein [Nitratifractor sp.]